MDSHHGGFWKRFFEWKLDSVLINSGFLILGGIINPDVVADPDLIIYGLMYPNLLDQTSCLQTFEAFKF